MVEVTTLFIGGGPATLGVFSNAYQTNRIEELVRSKVAIVESTSMFGGGNL